MSSVSSPLTASRSPSPEPLVQPDHFYGTDPSQLPPSPDSEGKTFLSPDDDPLAHRGIPVFKPSMHEFADFEGYMTRVECWGRRSGIVKIIPPKEWSAALPDVVPQLAHVKIKSPIEQFMRGRAGLFRQENMEKRKQMSVREWAELCAKPEFRAPGKDQVGLHNNPSAQPAPRTRRKKAPSKPKSEPAEPDTTAMASPPNTASPDPEDTKPTTPVADADADADADANDADNVSPKKPQRNRRTERADKDASFLDSFVPHKDWLPPDTVATDYTPEFCAKLERAFWRNCGLARPAWYGADTMGSLFTPATTAWNVATLPSTLSRLLPLSSGGLPGVNTPYLYFGMWRATFAWHVEDMDLFSINYIHFGAPKFWYAVPQGRAGALEGTMRGYFPADTSTCPQFLRHKSFLASPSLLSQSAVRPNHLVQHAGEFVVTFPRGYHAGFNLGLNCAESVNFALDSWLDEGRKAGVCGCVDFSVRIDVDQLLEDRRIDALELTDPAAAAHARAVRDGLIPDGDLEGDGAAVLDVDMPAVDTPAPSATSKGKQKATPTKTPTPSTGAAKPRQTPRKRKPTAPFEPEGPAPKRTFPCCLCVAPSHTGLLRVHDLPAAWREIGGATAVHYPPSAGGKGVWMAHEGCAMVLPETWVDEVVVSGHGGERRTERVVFGVDGIERARWNLKCSTCPTQLAKAHGALIQCVKGKCSKAFHINCARAGVEEGTGIAYTVVREVEKEVVLLEPAPPSHGGGAEPNLRVLKVIHKTEVEALCAQHNPVIVASRRASKAESLRADVLALPPLSRIKIRVSSGVFEVTLMRVLEDRRAVEVLWDAGEVREVKWTNIVLGLGVGQIEYGGSPSLLRLPLLSVPLWSELG
ncbi:JmjC-domain-containing protein [Mycena metata]|uniref:JmjC-domain-containing protein n=1 Tax=Mycena metata TaxID=1033252 RepID=A0AAD7JPQ1_9AGAR|nr:JmjC-domain-containing protein [Mycena metata]